MLTSWVKIRDLLERLRADKDGMVSFVIVAVCIVAAVGGGFGSATAGNITTALTTGIGTVTTAFTTAVAG